MNTKQTDYPREADKLAGLLAREIQPPRDLWPDIEAGLSDRGNQPRTGFGKAIGRGVGNRQWLQVAAALVLVIGSSLTTLWVVDNDAGLATGLAPAAEYLFAGSQFDEPEMLAVSLLPADARAGVIRSLALTRLARAGIEEELQKYPNNMQLLELWRFAYEQEAELLNNATWATIASTQRTTT